MLLITGLTQSALFAFGRAVRFDDGARILARSAKIRAQKIVRTLLPQAESVPNAGYRVGPVNQESEGFAF
jgi:hypothetical protein